MENKLRVMIVDDHDIFRKGLYMILKELEYVDIVGEAADGTQFLNLLNKKETDIVLMDMRMPMMSGEEAAVTALKRFPNLKIIIVSIYGEETQLEKMINVGVSGFLLKNVNKETIDKALKITRDGGNYFSEELLPILTNSIKKKSVPRQNLITDKEMKVLQGLCHGQTNYEISNRLYISVRTVEGYKANLIRKTGVSNTLNLVIYAVKHDLVKL
jgi:DNA-binding NarL/FixJ family response regulator